MFDQSNLEAINSAIQAGMAWMDANPSIPEGWLTRLQEAVSKRDLRLQSCTSCALAIAAMTDYSTAIEALDNDDRGPWDLGFDLAGEDLETWCAALGEGFFTNELTSRARAWHVLTLAWEWNIMARVAGVQP